MGPVETYGGGVPTQQLPAAIYWRRRLLVLAGLIGFIWIITALWPGGGSSGERPDEAKPTGTASTEPVDQEPTTENGPVDVRLTSGKAACDPTNVRVTPTVRSGQRSRQPVEIGLVMSTTAKKSCTLSVKDADLIAIISANKKPVWDSTVCKQSLLSEPVELTARWSTLVLTEWSGRGSGTNCSKKVGWAPGGDYTVEAGTLGGEPGKVTFSLKKAEPSPKPSESEGTDKKDEKKTD